MRYETRTERIGEELGPVDWSYDFRSHFDSYGTSPERRDEMCAARVEKLREVAASPENYVATTDGGWPRVGWHRVIRVCMYDGWPYWRPVPTVVVIGTFGVEYHSFSSITDFRKQP